MNSPANTTINELNKTVPIIKVIGVGGAGGNAISHMIARGVEGVDFIATNTDAQALARTAAKTMIRLGSDGLGAGANPTTGREAALAARKQIAQYIEGANMVFITAGMGGGTGTGAAPVVAEIAREMGILTVGVVTKPFEFEGARRMRSAQQGIEELSRHVDSLIVVLNEKLLEVLGEDVTQVEAFKAADDVLYNATAGVAEIINKPGLINVDFQDVRTVMGERGRAMMGAGVASGADRARLAAEMAIACPLLEGVELSGARGLLVNICASPETLKMKEPRDVMAVINQYVDEDATIIYGAVRDEAMGDDLRVTIIATGLDGSRQARVAEVDTAVRFGAHADAAAVDAGIWTPAKREPTANFGGQAPRIPEAAVARTRREPAPEIVMQEAPVAAKPADAAVNHSRLDIPAFLRKYQRHA